MRRSEKILLAILIIGLLTWQGERLVNRLLVAPIRRSHAELDRLGEEIVEQDRQSAALERLESELARWHQRSLPPDPLTAQRLYQQWLTDLAQDCGFDSLKVFPDRVMRKNDACMAVLVSIDAEARLGQLCLFLNRFYQTDLAHHVTMLNTASTQDQGDPILRVTVMAEGLSLRGAPARQRLFTTGTLADDLNDQESTVRILGVEAFRPQGTFVVRIGGETMHGKKLSETEWTVERGAEGSTPTPHQRGDLVEFIPRVGPPSNTFADDYANLVTKNPFAKPTPAIVEQPAPAKVEAPEIDPAEFTYLVAAFAQDDQRQAWLYDRLNNANVVISPGQPFSVAGVDGVVQEIGDDFVVFNYRAVRWRLRLGRSLSSMERLPDAAED